VLEEVNIVVTDAIPRFIVKDTVGSYAGSTWRFDWNTSIKASMGSLLDVRPVTEPLVFEEVVDDMDFAGILVVAIGSFVSFRNIDGVLTNREASANMIRSLPFDGSVRCLTLE